jgi:hypothetical protein
LEQSARARIFLSCGQQKGSNEIKIAKAVSRNLERQGFATYIAVEEQTLEGITDNIFKKLEESEYFIFIDFRREPLGGLNKGKPVYRGGLFSQQELAVATFLKKPVIAFQETDIKSLDGILQFVQANSFTFETRQFLPTEISRAVRKKRWNPNWRNQLVIDRIPTEHEDAIFISG